MTAFLILTFWRLLIKKHLRSLIPVYDLLWTSYSSIWRRVAQHSVAFANRELEGLALMKSINVIIWNQLHWGLNLRWCYRHKITICFIYLLLFIYMHWFLWECCLLCQAKRFLGIVKSTANCVRNKYSLSAAHSLMWGLLGLVLFLHSPKAVSWKSFNISVSIKLQQRSLISCYMLLQTHQHLSLVRAIFRSFFPFSLPRHLRGHYSWNILQISRSK